jgi:hypothetical protein
MIYLYDFEATKAMMDRVGEPAALKPVKAKAIRPRQHRLATMLQSVRRARLATSDRPAAQRPATRETLVGHPVPGVKQAQA